MSLGLKHREDLVQCAGQLGNFVCFCALLPDQLLVTDFLVNTFQQASNMSFSGPYTPLITHTAPQTNHHQEPVISAHLAALLETTFDVVFFVEFVCRITWLASDRRKVASFGGASGGSWEQFHVFPCVWEQFHFFLVFSMGFGWV